MTREEYERLLQSPYWKGYSYSLIKERNFTCQDCGRSFPNERNKLQVHHLVYRDAMPWSYDPDELVVLCEECHKKRHGIIPETKPVEDEWKTSRTDGYTRSYSSDYNTSERDVKSPKRSFPSFPPKMKKGRKALLAIFCVLAALLYFGNSNKKKVEEKTVFSEPALEETEHKQNKNKKAVPIVNNQPGNISEQLAAPEISAQEVVLPSKPIWGKAREVIEDAHTDGVPATDQISEVQSLDLPPTIDISESDPVEVAKPADPAEESRELTSLELLERKNYENAVKQARRAGVSTEGTTLEILERINHANVVKQAQRAGVSTEGTTLEILERIIHANVVKQAQRAGVSTEGSTLDILERINHANVVKQAQRAGVSTEGTTLEILERINRKNLENSGY